jgi:hypothetical protein
VSEGTGNEEGQIIGLEASRKFLHSGNYICQEQRWRERTKVTEARNEPRFSECLTRLVHRLRYTIAVNNQEIAWMQRGLLSRALPFFEKSENGGSGRKPVDLSVGA